MASRKNPHRATNAFSRAGAIAESIEVTARREAVQVSTSGNIGTNYEQRVIESLPIVGGRGRNVLDQVLSQPGVVATPSAGPAGST